MKRLLSTFALSALLSWPAVVLAGKADDTLNVAFNVEPTTMDTYKETTREGNILARLLYDCLIEKDAGTGEFKPALASSYKVVDDRTIDFEIRRGVKFHNGETLTPEDVVYTFNLVSTKEYGARYQIAVDWIERAERIGENGVRLHMKRTYPLALEMLAGNLPVYPKTYYEKAGPSGMATKPVGAGPYRLVDITPGARFVFERFDDYYAESPKGRPAIKRVIVRVLPEMNTQYAELLNGGLDWVWRVSPDDARNLARRPNVEVKGIEILRYSFVSFYPGFGDGKTPFADVRVRQALTHAVNREGIVKAFVGGAAQVMHGACSHLQFGCTNDVKKYPYDPATAKKLLAEAGFPNGFSTDILVSYMPKEQAEAIAANFAAVGVKANLNFQQYAPALTAWREGRVPMFVGSWGSYGVADIGLGTSQFFAGTADDLAKDPEVIPLLQEADSSMDRDLRKRNYEKAIQLIAERAYWLPLWTFNVNTASSKDLDFNLSADEYARFYEAKWK